MSDESGEAEIYVRLFPDVERQRQKVSVDGGMEPSWSSDGRELYYRDGQALMAVGVQTGETLTLGAPQVLFGGSFYFAGLGRKYAVAPDGRFLMIQIGSSALIRSLARNRLRSYTPGGLGERVKRSWVPEAPDAPDASWGRPATGQYEHTILDLRRAPSATGC